MVTWHERKPEEAIYMFGLVTVLAFAVHTPGDASYKTKRRRDHCGTKDTLVMIAMCLETLPSHLWRLCACSIYERR